MRRFLRVLKFVVIAALIIANICLGLYFADLPSGPSKGELAHRYTMSG